MLDQYTLWEVLLATAAFALVGTEVVSLIQARRRGLTRNVSRLVTHGLVMVLLVAYVGYGLYWHRLVTSPDFASRVDELPTFSWPYLLLGLMLVLLISYELVAVFRARRLGWTSNLSRLLSRGAVVVLLLLLAEISGQKWQLYLEKVLDTYEEQAIPAIFR
jgi:hypothetical protein